MNIEIINEECEATCEPQTRRYNNDLLDTVFYHLCRITELKVQEITNMRIVTATDMQVEFTFMIREGEKGVKNLTTTNTIKIGALI